MNTIDHPAIHIAPQLVAALRKLTAEAEQLKQLHPAQLAIIQQQKWFRLFVPKRYDGLQFNLPEALQLEEALAWTDGAVGWTVTLCAGAGWFIGFLDPQLASRIFNDNAVCIAGSGKTSGIAKKVAGGYEVTGHWDYASGANHATAFTANCLIEEDGAGSLLKNENDAGLVKAFLFLKEEVTIHDNWKRIGMVATGSNSFAVKGLVVNKDRAFVIDQQQAVLKDAIYHYPFLQFAETTLAVNSSGMALRFIDCCAILFEQQSNSKMQSVLKEAMQELETVRQLFYTTVTRSWEACETNLSIPTPLLESVSSLSKQLAVISRRLVDELYPYCGMQAADPGTEINRVWRNLHTASQHSIFNR